jgi:heme A synthase
MKWLIGLTAVAAIAACVLLGAWSIQPGRTPQEARSGLRFAALLVALAAYAITTWTRQREEDRVQQTFTRATELARSGRVGQGYDALLGGLFQARMAQARGETWANALVRRYELAIEGYVTRYGTGEAGPRSRGK